MAQYPNLSELDDIKTLDQEKEEFESDSDEECEDISDDEESECNLQYDEYGQLLERGSKVYDESEAGVSYIKSEEAESADKKLSSTSSTEQIPYTRISWITVSRGPSGKMGLTLRKVGKKYFLAYVEKGSEAAKMGLGFGDQVLAIQGMTGFGRSGINVMQWIKNQNAKQFTFKILKKPYDFVVKAVRETTNELVFYNKSNMHLGTVSISKLAHTGSVKEFRIIAVDNACTVGFNEGELLARLQKNPQSTKSIRLMPGELYRRLVKHQSKDRIGRLMQLSPLK